MIPLEQKLLDLNLTVMSHRLETTLSEAAGKEFSVRPRLWNGSPTWNWKRVTAEPSSAVSNARNYRHSPASTRFTSLMTRAVRRTRIAYCVLCST